MAAPAPAERDVPGLYAVAQHADLVRQGVLGPDDHVELLEGVIVATSPKNPWHDTIVNSRRDDAVEAFRDPNPETARYGTHFFARRGERLGLVALGGATVDVAALLPPAERP